METKICIACCEELPLDNFFVHNASTDGYRRKCIQCTKNKVEVDKEKIQNFKKNCSKCGDLLYINNDNFSLSNKSQDGYSSECKTCNNLKYTKKEIIIPEKNFVDMEDFKSGVKVCKRCKNMFYANNKYFYKRNDKKDGLSNNCIVCTKAIKEENKIIKNKIKNFKKKSIKKWNTNIDKLFIITKECNKCNRLLLINSFNVNHKNKTLLHQCKDCIAEYKKEHSKLNYEHISNYKKEWAIENQERLIKNRQRYYIENKEILSEKQSQYYQDNKEIISERTKQYREENKEKIAKRKRKYYYNNIELMAEKNKNSRNALISSDSISFVKLSKYDECRIDPDNSELGQVKCIYCGKWVNPTRSEVRTRLGAINGTGKGEARIYCHNSDDEDGGCKTACPTYGQVSRYKDYTRSSSREVDPFVRKLCFERDQWTCQRCGIKDVQLQAHHILSYTKNPILSNDIQNVVTFCKKCHIYVHSQDGCRYHDLKCDI